MQVPKSVVDSIKAVPLPPIVSNRLPPGRYYPPVRSVVIGRDGTTWIEGWPTSDGRSWQVLGPSGALVGELRFPLQFRLKEAGKGYALGLLTDSLDVPSIVKYAIQ